MIASWGSYPRIACAPRIAEVSTVERLHCVESAPVENCDASVVVSTTRNERDILVHPHFQERTWN